MPELKLSECVCISQPRADWKIAREFLMEMEDDAFEACIEALRYWRSGKTGKFIVGSNRGPHGIWNPA